MWRLQNFEVLLLSFKAGNLWSSVVVVLTSCKSMQSYLSFSDFFPPPCYVCINMNLSQGYLHFSTVTSSADLEKSMPSLSRTPHVLPTTAGNSNASAFQLKPFWCLDSHFWNFINPRYFDLRPCCLLCESWSLKASFFAWQIVLFAEKLTW